MKYIYSPSYPSIRLICYFLQQGEEVTVISSNPDIIKLCKMMSWPVVTFNYNLENKPRVYEIWNPFKIITFKKELRKLFLEISSQCKTGQLYFTTLCIDLLGLDLMARFASERRDLNVTYWQESITSIHKKVLPNNIRSVAQLIYFNLLYKPNFYYFECQGGRFLGAQSNFLSRFKISEWLGPDIHEIDVYKDLRIPHFKGSVFIIGGYSLEMDSEVFDLTDLKEIYRFIHEIVPDVYYKPHPGCEKIEPFFDHFHILPAYMPSEFLVNQAKIVISTATTAMNYLAKSGVVCLSVMDLIKTHKTSYKKEWKDKMSLESKGRIKFICSRDELKNICKDI